MILHIGKFFPPFFGGIEKVNYDIVKGLNLKGYKSDVICYNHKNGNLSENKKKYNIFRTNVIFDFFGQPISLDFAIKLKNIINKYEILHLHLPNPFAAFFTLLFIKDQKLVLHWHNDIVKQKLFLFFYYPILNRLLLRADKIIGTSENYINNSKFLKKFKSKCNVVPIGISADDVPEDKNFTKELKKIYRGKKIILSVGRLSKYKGFSYLISSIKYLDKNEHLIIIGKGEEESLLKKLVAKLKLNSRVEIISNVEHSRLGSYYSLCDVFCMSSISRNEGFGIVQLEAMLYSKPIITTDIPGSGITFGNINDKTGFVIPIKDDIKIAKAIKNILYSDKIDFFKKNSLKRVENIFSKEKMIFNIINLYNNL